MRLAIDKFATNLLVDKKRRLTMSLRYESIVLMVCK